MKFALGCVLVCILYAFMALPILLGVRLGKSLESRAKQRRLLREAEADRLERGTKGPRGRTYD